MVLGFKRLRIRLLMCLLLIGLHGSAIAQQYTVSYVASKHDPDVVSLFDQLKSKFSDKTFHLANINDAAIKKGSNIYIAAGPQAFNYLIKSDIKAPIIAVLISSVAYYQILENHHLHANQKSITAIFSDVSVDQQIALARAIFPKNLSVSIITSEKTYFITRDIKQDTYKDIPVSVVPHKNNTKIIETLKRTRQSRVLIALPNSDIYNKETFKTIIYSLYRRNQFMIGFSRKVTKAGGLATAYIELQDIASETINSLSYYFSTQKLIQAKHPKGFNIWVNKRVANSLNVVLPDKRILKQRTVKFLEECCAE